MINNHQQSPFDVSLFQSFLFSWDSQTQGGASSLRDSALPWADMFLLFQSEYLKATLMWISDLDSFAFPHRYMLNYVFFRRNLTLYMESMQAHVNVIYMCEFDFI